MKAGVAACLLLWCAYSVSEETPGNQQASSPEKGAVKVVLDAGTSFDPDGDNLTFEWRQVQGQPVVLYEAASARPFFYAVKPGTYAFTVRAFDGELFSDTVTVTREVKGANAKPVAVPGKDRKVRLGSTLLLDGRGSRDPEGATLRYQWQDVSGPEALVGQAGSEKPVLRLKPKKEGTYIARLKVSDGERWSDPQEIRVDVLPANKEPVVKVSGDKEVFLPEALVDNKPPVAKVGPGSTVKVGEWAVLDGTASYDLDGDVIAYFWYQESGPLVRELRQVRGMGMVKFQVEEPGLYKFRLVVSDGRADSEPAYVEVHAIDDRPAPSVTLPKEIKATAGERVTLDGSVPKNRVGEEISGSWKQLSGPRVTDFFVDQAQKGLVTSFVPLEAGEYLFQLTVSDADGRTSQAEAKVIVIPANLPPAVEAPSQVTASGGNAEIPFRAVDPDGDKVEVAAEVIGGRMAVRNVSAKNVAVEQIETAGVVRLFFRDGRGGTTARDVAIETGAGGPGIVAVSIDGERRVGVEKRLGLKAVGENKTELPGQAKYQWCVEGSGLYLSPKAALEKQIIVYPAKPGVYTFKVTVTVDGKKGVAEGVVEVAKAGEIPSAADTNAPLTIETAVKMLASQDESEKDRAAAFLVEKGRDALPALAAALKGDNADVRREAVAIAEYVTGEPAAKLVAHENNEAGGAGGGK